MDISRVNPYQGFTQEELNRALGRCAYEGKHNEVALLIQSEADVNAVVGIFKESALMSAVRGNHIDIVELLIQHGAKIEATHAKGRTVFMYSVEHSTDLNIIELLIRKGININATDHNGNTALMNLFYMHSDPNLKRYISSAKKDNKNNIAYRLLWEMTPEKRKDFAEINEEYNGVVVQFEKELIDNSKKILKLTMKLKDCPADIWSILIKFFMMLYPEDFSTWYQPCINNHFSLSQNYLQNNAENSKPVVFDPFIQSNAHLPFYSRHRKFRQDLMEIDGIIEPENNNEGLEQIRSKYK